MSSTEAKGKVRLPPGKIELKRLGIFGGTFDPIHLGHLICAEQICESLNLDLVMFVPCALPPHKPGYLPAQAKHRLAMINLAIKGSERFCVSDIELSRGGLSYTVDTVRQIRSELGDEVEIWLILGLDAYIDLPTWKEPNFILDQCNLAVATRPGYSLDSVCRIGKKVEFVEITAVDISSSEIRRRIAAGKSIRFLVPEAVEYYIRTEKPYSCL